MDRMRSRVIWELGALLKSVVLSCKKFSEVYEVHMVFSACEIFYSLLYTNVVGVRPILPFHLFVSLFFLLLFFYTVCSQTTVIWIGKYEFLNETEDCNPESYWVQNLVIFCKVAAPFSKYFTTVVEYHLDWRQPTNQQTIDGFPFTMFEEFSRILCQLDFDNKQLGACNWPCRIHDCIKVRLYCWNLSRQISSNLLFLKKSEQKKMRKSKAP